MVPLARDLNYTAAKGAHTMAKPTDYLPPLDWDDQDTNTVTRERLTVAAFVIGAVVLAGYAAYGFIASQFATIAASLP
jgi:hypothetical protein